MAFLMQIKRIRSGIKTLYLKQKFLSITNAIRFYIYYKLENFVSPGIGVAYYAFQIYFRLDI